jgi:hypothetical protein
MRRLPSVLRLLAIAAFVVGMSACGGRPANLVVVSVSGLLPRITELYVTMQLDDVPALNSKPMAESGTSAFVVYQQMERFGISIPDNTRRLTIDVKGFDTAREIVRQAQGSLDLSHSHDLSIELVAP